MKKFTPIWEIIIGFFLLDMLNYFVFPEDPAFQLFQIHPYWIVILLASTRYGLWMGTLSGLVAACHFVLIPEQGIPSRVEIEQMLELGQLLLPLIFILTGILVGNIRQMYKNQETQVQEKLTAAGREVEQLVKNLEAAEKNQRILESRIVGTATTVKTIYDAAKIFEATDSNGMYKACLDVLGKYFWVKKASVYVREGSYLILKASHGWTEGETVEGKMDIRKSIMNIAITHNDMLTVKDILKHKGAEAYQEQFGKFLAMIPFRNSSGEAIGVVNIEHMDFLLFNRPNLEVIQMIIEWANNALESKMQYKKLVEKNIFDDELGIYTFKHFGNVLEHEFNRAKTHAKSLTLTCIYFKIDKFGFFLPDVQRLISKQFVASVKLRMRPIDRLFQYKFDGMFVLVCPMRTAKEQDKIYESVNKDFEEANKVLKSPVVVRKQAVEYQNSMVSFEDMIPKKL
ncbi:hypothetical protein IIB34_08825 [PVC group bacterium]|nr:hypothetical protein [PVC group bacterium]